MGDFAFRFQKIRDSVPAEVKIVAVSKFHALSEIEEMYADTGHTLFGENRALELHQKASTTAFPLQWHFQGKLQTNKIKWVIPHAALIHSVDSRHLLEALDRSAAATDQRLSCLLQFHIAREEAKQGFFMDEVERMAEEGFFNRITNITLCGVMGMASFTDDFALVRNEFSQLRKYFEHLRENYFFSHPEFKEVSMGMSADYRIAIDEGSTLVRIGTAIFGERQ